MLKILKNKLKSNKDYYDYLSKYNITNLNGNLININGVTYYLYKNKISYHIHGHLHKSYRKEMLNGTKEICIYICMNILS